MIKYFFNPFQIHERDHKDYYLISMVRQEKEIKLFELEREKK